MLILGDIEMKLTTKILKQLIKEEIEAVINETEEGRPGDKTFDTIQQLEREINNAKETLSQGKPDDRSSDFYHTAYENAEKNLKPLQAQLTQAIKTYEKETGEDLSLDYSQVLSENIEESNAASSMEMDIQQLMGMLNISYDEAKEMLLKNKKK